jgi:hypothetical protein
MNKRGFPDWRNGSRYPAPGITSPQQWAWEFLRRNPRYQQLWDRLIKPHYNRALFNKHWRDIQNRNSPGRRTRPRLGGLRHPPSRFQVRFGIASDPPPPWESEAKLLFESQLIQYEVGHRLTTKIYGHLEPGQIVLWFQLNLPIKAQIANANKLLKQKRTDYLRSGRDNRMRDKKYRDYLRVLDAKLDGVAAKPIARTIYPKISNGERRVSDDFRAAKLLRDKTYRQLAGMMK